MKTMTCQQLGGVCEQTFTANTFEEIADFSKQHGMEMYEANDEAHIEAMNKMMELMKSPEAMMKWFEEKRVLFDGLAED
ncbi:MAG: DUF1059 domain-containing protein [Flavobacteriales bacterium]|nr:MAG: DUF1059 domain-containing protein [Flavobacteriales bacterium]